MTRSLHQLRRAVRGQRCTHRANNLWTTEGSAEPQTCGQRCSIHNTQRELVASVPSLWEAGETARIPKAVLTSVFGQFSTIHTPITTTKEHLLQEDWS